MEVMQFIVPVQAQRRYQYSQTRLGLQIYASQVRFDDTKDFSWLITRL